MASSSSISWLCNFLQESCNIITDNEANCLSKENERDLLIALSRVCRHIQDPKNGPKHEDGRNGPIDDTHDIKWCKQGEHTTDHSCLQLITKTLVMLLALENQFVSHSAGKALLVLAHYLVKSVSEWKAFLHLLWISLKGVCFSSDVQPICDVTKGFESFAVDPMSAASYSIDLRVASCVSYWIKDIQCSNLTVESTWTKKRWIAASQLMQLLRNVLKTCCFRDKKLAHAYLHITEPYILDVAWLLLNNPCFEEIVQSADSLNVPCVLSERNRGYLDPQKDLALGALLQLLCSLVHIIMSGYSEGEGEVILNQWPILMKINELVPALSIQSLAVHNHPEGGCITHFLRYKLMMLMIRLSDSFLQKPCTFVVWLELLWKHASDLLGQSLLGDHKILESSVAESPFGTCSDYCNKGVLVSTSHLQRRAVFLLFKCSFILIRQDWKTPKVQTSFECHSVVRENEASLSQPNAISELDSQHTGSALRDWLLRHMPCASVFNDRSLRIRYNVFASNFMHLFMGEDDLMFEMLLQLLNFPLEQVQYNGDKEVGDGVCGDSFLQLLKALNPIVLFHIFLAKIQYDHSILLDYLISKGTGVLCLRYLLRCLRIICASWPDFTELPGDTNDVDNFASKRREHHLARNEPLEKHTHRTLETFSSSQPSSVASDIMVQNEDNSYQLRHTMRKRKRKNQLPPMSSITNKNLRFENAKRCLLSLKVAIENLHQKDLFPYNPFPLLKRFEAFVHLCNARPGNQNECNKN